MNPLWSNIFRKKPEEESLAYFLGTIPLFSDLKNRELHFLESIVHQRHYDAGEVIFTEGDPGTGLYVIRSGKVSIYNHDAYGKRCSLVQLVPGDFFGETTLAAPANRAASARTTEQCELIGLFRADMEEISKKYPMLANKILVGLARLLSERLHLAAQQLNKAQVQGAPDEDGEVRKDA